jgi:hypothetical protein
VQRFKLWLSIKGTLYKFASKYSSRVCCVAAAANKLLSVHVTTAAAERNWYAWGRTYTNIRNSLGLGTADMMI